MNGMPSQTLTITIPQKLAAGSVSQFGPVMPMSARTWLTKPNWLLSSVRQIASETICGTAQGRMMSAR